MPSSSVIRRRPSVVGDLDAGVAQVRDARALGGLQPRERAGDRALGRRGRDLRRPHVQLHEVRRVGAQQRLAHRLGAASESISSATGTRPRPRFAEPHERALDRSWSVVSERAARAAELDPARAELARRARRRGASMPRTTRRRRLAAARRRRGTAASGGTSGP